MKPYTQPELRTFVAEDVSKLIGSQLQEVLASDRGLALGFWKSGTRWLVIDLAPGAPLAMVFDQEKAPFRKGERTKPVGLFLSSKGRNKILREAVLDEDRGRVLLLHLSNQEGDCGLEICLVPKHANLIVRSEGKQISWEKPKELPSLVGEFEAPASRSMQAVRDAWLAESRGEAKPALDPAEQWRKKRDKDLEKKQKALAEIEKTLGRDDAVDWYRKGDAIKAGSDDKSEWIDPTKPKAWNIEQAYAKAKQITAKRAGTEERRQILTKEIEELRAATFESAKARQKPAQLGKDLLQSAEARGRKLNLESGLTAFIGKSGADNLALLRKAKAWDYWMHLRDYPGAHAILHRNKDQRVADKDLQRVAQWLAKESLGNKARAIGQKLEVVWTECRYVRPIKGDKLGRVNYQDEKHFFIQWSE